MPSVPSVLIVEDSYLLLEIVASLFESQGVRVLEASTGEAALTLLRSRGHEIDWLFTDIHLPGLIDGWTVAQEFRALRPDRPVVYSSADTTALRPGVTRSLFLRKPFQMREVNALVKAITRDLPQPVSEAC